MKKDNIMIIVSASTKANKNVKIAISFLGKDGFIAAMEKIAECQGEYGMFHNLNDAIYYFEEAFQMLNTCIVNETTYRESAGEWHESIEQLAYGLGWQE